MLGDIGMTRVVMICLVALAINAVLIQTVAADDSVLNTAMRVGVLVLAALAVTLHAAPMPVGIVLLTIYSAVLLAVRQNPDQLSFVFIFVLIFALFAVRERSLDKAVMFASLASLGMVLVLVFLSLGITQNEVLDFRGRNTFGTNGVPFFYNLVYGAFGMLVFYFYKYKLRRRLLVMAGSVTLTTHLFNLTDARGECYSFIGFVALVFLVPALSRLGLFRFIAAMLPVICLMASFYIASLWDNGAANQLLSIWPILFNRFLENLTPVDVFLSTSVKEFDLAVTIVDNSYLHLLVGGGAAMCLVFFVIFAQSITNLFKAGRHVDVAFLIATCVYFNSESILLRIENMFVIYFWYLVLRYCNPMFPHSQQPRVLVPIEVSKPRKHKKNPKVLVPDWQRKPMADVAAPSKPGHLPDWARPDRIDLSLLASRVARRHAAHAESLC
jgi:hypothetical protein